MRGLPHQRLPTIADCIELNLRCASLTNPEVRLIGLSINTANLGTSERDACLARLSAEHGLPAVDPLVTGVAPLVDRLA